MKKGILWVGLMLVIALVALPVGAQDTIIIEASQDNTIYDDQPFNGACGAGGGQLANGAGPDLFAGYLEAFDDTKRALVQFDLSAIPADATVVSATLTLNVNRTVVAGPRDFAIHRLLGAWGEGASNASGGGGGGGGGAGDQAVAPDATWCESMFGSVDWTTLGGDFALPSDSITIDGPEPLGLGPATWGSTPEMVADVQSWIDDPASNFGWIVLGDENLAAGEASTKRFDSREATDPAVRPTLTIGIESVPVVAIPTLGEWGLLLMAGLLLGGGLWAVGRMR